MVSVMLYHCLCCSVNGSVWLCVACLAVFVNYMVNQFAISLGVVAILLLNVLDVFSACVVLYWIDYVWSSKECVVPVMPVCV